MFYRCFNQPQPSVPHGWEQPCNRVCKGKLYPGDTDGCSFPSHCLYWLKKSLVSCQARTSNAVCCSSVYVNWTDEYWYCVRLNGSQGSPFLSRLCCRVPARYRSTRWTHCWWVRRVRLLVSSSAMWGGVVTLYTVKEMSKKSRERRGCRCMKAPAGEEAEVNGCSCGQGGSCVFTEPAFTLQSSELTPR